VPDYGRPVAFGFFLVPDADGYPELVAQARLADRLGLEFVAIQDHPYQRRYLDTWTLLSALAVQTERLGLFPDVANLPLRQPAVLAKAAASLDLMTGGRVELGLGAGGFWDAIEGMGGPRRSPGEAVAALEDALAVIRLMWSGQRSIRHDGEHYAVHGVHPGPRPAHDIGIWIGALGPRMLALTGRSGDGWIPSSSYVPPEKLAPLRERIDDAARESGRDPAEVRRLYNVSGRITDGVSAGFANGPVAQWAEELTRLTVEEGMDTYVYWPSEDPAAQLHRFAEEVAPAVREQVARERDRSQRRHR
jgi:alkanesulfonate monooxygenase SsuD/methylene tetrahydromethanopterin reductase-like flavin-dependent oxidoreductase (luciferase family)